MGYLSGGHKIKAILSFVLGFLVSFLPYAAMFFKFDFNVGYEGAIQAFVTSILFGIVGITLWIVFQFKLRKKFLGLGFLIGGLTTFLISIPLN
ncbi:hypothetical protein LOZ80_12180 [Paenibacillus sp. HWE-109]|uniref:hypothetical protein n=1 Tax=Paenibacillus sp. HWE-109 TaxID=1306526 RepID=UPI001EE0B5D3|nr:hypothetical protein [Paenibacillus sp. HWE-109]UKS29642.1 hypothetical protein LOZ80_12180 [Paenibacillus sp. HWE-109]